MERSLPAHRVTHGLEEHDTLPGSGERNKKAGSSLLWVVGETPPCVIVRTSKYPRMVLKTLALVDRHQGHRVHAFVYIKRIRPILRGLHELGGEASRP